MRITIVQGAFLPVPPLLGGAVEKVWHALGGELARQGHRVVHLSRAYDGLPLREEAGGVQHRRLRGYDTPRSLWRLKLCDLLYSLRVQRALPPADILVTNTFWLPLLERRRSRGRLYVHVARYPKGQLRFYPRRAILQTVSEPIRAAILRETQASTDVRVVPYPLAPAYLVPRTPAAPVILYAGRVHPEKGVHLLLDAFSRLSRAGLRGWKLRIVGPWESRQGGGGQAYWEQLRAAAGANAHVEFIGPVFDEARLVSSYQEAAIFAYPSLAARGETFGLAVLEAMAAGCAPVVSALPCFGDFVTHDENGLIFDHQVSDPAAELARTLGGLVENATRRECLRAAAWTRARDYTLPAIAMRFAYDFRMITENPDGFRCPNILCKNPSP